MDIDIFNDLKTDMQAVEQANKLPGTIHLDSTIMTIGMCSLQVTFGSACLSDARWLYDQYSLLSPVWLALSASMPFTKGMLINCDTRWPIMMGVFDDRNPRERAEGCPVPSRWFNVPKFISEDKRNLPYYNDLKGPTINKKARKFLVKELAKEGIKLDKLLIDHYATLYSKEMITIFEKTAERLKGRTDTSIFEAFHGSVSTNVRLKPPPSLTSDIGWRTEFRVMDA